jgi:DnaJ-class molecular chaperone
MEVNPGDQAASGTPGTGEDVCPSCHGSGRVGSESCRKCGGSGRVIESIGGG